MIVNYGSCIVSLQKEGEFYTLVFNVTPYTEEIDLIAEGYRQIGNTIKVPVNTQVRCEAILDGYVPYVGVVTVTQDETLNVTLEQGVKCTINPTPADATVVFTIDGYTHEINELDVPINRAFTYTVSKENYETKTETITITEPTTINVNLKPFTPLDLNDYSFVMNDNHDVTLVEYTGTDPDVTVPSIND
jgi:hypothetical protein